MDLQGVFPPIPTPFDERGTIDAHALQRNMEWWNRHALSGVAVLGSNGEAVHLTDGEQEKLIAQARRLLPPDQILIAGASAFSTHATTAAVNRAANAGANAALVLPPFYYKNQMTPDVLVKHFSTIADAASIPIILYNVPANTGIDIDAETIICLSQHDNVIGLKDSGGNMAKLSQVAGSAAGGFRVLAGSAGFLLPALAVGASGGILALANIAPEYCLRILQYHDAGQSKEAAALQGRITSLNTAVTRRWGVPGLKAAMDRMGLYGGPPRAPLVPLESPQQQELDTLLHATGLLGD